MNIILLYTLFTITTAVCRDHLAGCTLGNSQCAESCRSACDIPFQCLSDPFYTPEWLDFLDEYVGNCCNGQGYFFNTEGYCDSPVGDEAECTLGVESLSVSTNTTYSRSFLDLVDNRYTCRASNQKNLVPDPTMGRSCSALTPCVCSYMCPFFGDFEIPPVFECFMFQIELCSVPLGCLTIFRASDSMLSRCCPFTPTTSAATEPAITTEGTWTSSLPPIPTRRPTDIRINLEYPIRHACGPKSLTQLRADDTSLHTLCCTLDGQCAGREDYENPEDFSCKYQTTFTQAAYRCARNGLRLCGDEELARGACCGNECGFKNEMVWTDVCLPYLDRCPLSQGQCDRTCTICDAPPYCFTYHEFDVFFGYERLNTYMNDCCQTPTDRSQQAECGAAISGCTDVFFTDAEDTVCPPKCKICESFRDCDLYLFETVGTMWPKKFNNYVSTCCNSTEHLMPIDKKDLAHNNSVVNRSECMSYYEGCDSYFYERGNRTCPDMDVCGACDAYNTTCEHLGIWGNCCLDTRIEILGTLPATCKSPSTLIETYNCEVGNEDSCPCFCDEVCQRVLVGMYFLDAEKYNKTCCSSNLTLGLGSPEEDNTMDDPESWSSIDQLLFYLFVFAVSVFLILLGYFSVVSYEGICSLIRQSRQHPTMRHEIPVHNQFQPDMWNSMNFDHLSMERLDARFPPETDGQPPMFYLNNRDRNLIME